MIRKHASMKTNDNYECLVCRKCPIIGKYTYCQLNHYNYKLIQYYKLVQSNIISQKCTSNVYLSCLWSNLQK